MCVHDIRLGFELPVPLGIVRVYLNVVLFRLECLLSAVRTPARFRGRIFCPLFLAETSKRTQAWNEI